MLRWVLMVVLTLAVSSAVSYAGVEELCDEYCDSPTITLGTCSYPAMRVFIDDQETENRGFIRNSRVYLAARETLECIGGTVVWVKSEKSFYAKYPNEDKTICITVGSNAVKIYQYNENSNNGAGKLLDITVYDAAPFICEGRVFTPMRMALECTGGSIQYDRKAKAIYVYPLKKSPSDEFKRWGDEKRSFCYPGAHNMGTGYCAGSTDYHYLS